MSWVVKGILVGFVFSIFIGPVFFIYLQTAVKRGFRYGLMVGAGVWLADLVLVSFMNFNLDYIHLLLDGNKGYFWFSLFSGCILIGMGILVFVRQGRESTQAEDSELFDRDILVKKKKYTKFALAGRGFLVNFIQPFVVFYWLGVSINLTFKQHALPAEKALFFGGAFLTRMSMDLVKIFLGRSIKVVFTKDRMALFQRISGIILLIFGILLIANAWSEA